MTDRERLVAAAEGWLRTPYHHAARVHGVGVDCIGLLAAVYQEAGLVDRVELPFYPPDWMMHRDQERLLMGVREHRLKEVERPLPGDIALFRFGRCYSHGAIITEWPCLIHAFSGIGVTYGDATTHPLLDKSGQPRTVKFFSMLG